MEEPDANGATASCHKRAYAALMESTGSHMEQEIPVVIGRCVSENAVSRSGLLSGIGDTEGLASLPSQLSSDEVKLWETAYVIDVDLSPHDLATVLKVADALADAHESRWVQRLADKAKDTNWEQDVHDGRGMLCALLWLPPHILPRVLFACLKDRTVSNLITTFPPPLHPAIISAAVASCSLTISHAAAPTLLAHLPSTAVPSPGLLDLKLRELWLNEEMPMLSPPTAGAQLARALAAHPSLTFLQFSDVPLTPQWLRAFSSCLAPGALRHLARLSMPVCSHQSGCAEVGACLAALPAVTSLSVSIHINPSASTADSLTGYTRLAAGPSPLPLLKSLTLLEGSLRYSRCGADGEGPTLGRSTHSSCAHSLLSVLSAPALTRLDLLSRTARRPLHTLLAQVARFASLQKLALTVDPLISDVAACGRATAAEAPTLPALSSVHCECICTASSAALAAAVATMARASLTSLQVSVDDCGPSYPVEMVHECFPSERADAWQHLFAVLQTCGGLRELHLDCLPSVPPHSTPAVTAGLADSLVCLTQLSLLRLQADADAMVLLDGHLLGAALPKLSWLDTLIIDGCGGSIAFDPVEPVVGACAQMTKIAHMNLQFIGLTAEHVATVLSGLPDLRTLELCVLSLGPDTAAVTALQARFTKVDLRFSL